MLVIARLLSSEAGTGITRSKPLERNVVRKALSNLFGKYLFVTNTVTCGFMMAGGDIIQQKIEKYGTMKKDAGYDWVRTGRMFLVGLAQGPPQHAFYWALDRYIPGRGLRRAIPLKILLDQLIASPMCIAIFFLGMGFMEGREMSEDIRELKTKFWTVYMVDWMVWPPTQFINFYFLPPKYRVTYINLITMLYDVFLSYIHHDFK